MTPPCVTALLVLPALFLLCLCCLLLLLLLLCCCCCCAAAAAAAAAAAVAAAAAAVIYQITVLCRRAPQTSGKVDWDTFAPRAEELLLQTFRTRDWNTVKTKVQSRAKESPASNGPRGGGNRARGRSGL
jgi:hypothetical protein